MTEKSNKKKTTLEDLQKDFQNNNHIYFNDEWNGEYEDSYTGRAGDSGSSVG